MRTNLTLLSLLVLLCTAGCSGIAVDSTSLSKPEDHAVRVGLDPHRSQPVPTVRSFAHRRAR
ncbi:MAG: hypothetical protein ABI321_08815 [Polyangia bacterium]